MTSLIVNSTQVDRVLEEEFRKVIIILKILTKIRVKSEVFLRREDTGKQAQVMGIGTNDREAALIKVNQ